VVSSFAIKTPCGGWGEIDLSHPRLRIERIADLLEQPYSLSALLQVTVTLRLRRRKKTASPTLDELVITQVEN